MAFAEFFVSYVQRFFPTEVLRLLVWAYLKFFVGWRLRGRDAVVKQILVDRIDRRDEDVTILADTTNEQLYGNDVEFFESHLGPMMKYSACEWPSERASLAEAEEHTIKTYQQILALDALPYGSRVLEAGCGWGSLCLANASKFPNLKFVAFSNSPQQIEYVKKRAPKNLEVYVEDYADFCSQRTKIRGKFDAAVAIETIEHSRNVAKLLAAIADRLKPKARFFVHSLVHQTASYLVDDQDWLGRNFFSGGSILGLNSYLHLKPPTLDLVDLTPVSGVGYSKTLLAWLDKLEHNYDDFVSVYGIPFSMSRRRRRCRRPTRRGAGDIVFILADDIGWNNVGFTGRFGYSSQEDKKEMTPTLDKLAAAGVVLDSHYAYSVCTPSRSSFLTGRLPVYGTVELKDPIWPSAGSKVGLETIGTRLRREGYRTGVFGKWDMGGAAAGHLPVNRGFDASLVYLSHRVDYWTSRDPQVCGYAALDACGCARTSTFSPASAAEAAKRPVEKAGLFPCDGCDGLYDLWKNERPAFEHVDAGLYAEQVYVEAAIEFVEKKNDTKPFFALFAPHSAHCPLQPPGWAVDAVGLEAPELSHQTAIAYAAVLKVLDLAIARLLRHVEWCETLIVFTSDNGGAMLPPASGLDKACQGATNYPLRGGKWAQYEGGVRTATFVSGGRVPEHARGRRVANYPLHVSDWVATLVCGAARSQNGGSYCETAFSAWDLIIFNQKKTAPRRLLPLSHQTILNGSTKLIVGYEGCRDAAGHAAWSPPGAWPDAAASLQDRRVDSESRSSLLLLTEDQVAVLDDACLFDLEMDPAETRNLAYSRPRETLALAQALATLRTNFVPTFRRDPLHSLDVACEAVHSKWCGFLGPSLGLVGGLNSTRVTEGPPAHDVHPTTCTYRRDDGSPATFRRRDVSPIDRSGAVRRDERRLYDFLFTTTTTTTTTTITTDDGLDDRRTAGD
ncbi:hypothetical protein CTAYLR_001741 [Chrysophaeum taylorii]|uniref:Sulfatase N-terminal domain-containing protein n=1 Tax=Chrysophaeum taylorii TaxID=2483200 RepID=A0AAD7UEX0_9STRA|nr:hypothetical protein CTAYLR_001741 [Chrysophaeum taylorii]